MIKKTTKIHGNVHLTGSKPTLQAPVPPYIYLATANTRCPKIDIYVKPGDHVNMGQVIGMRQAAFFTQPVHSTVSGTYEGLEKHYHRSGKCVDFLKIKNDFKDTMDSSIVERTDEQVKALSHDEMTEIIKNCACVGLGGSSFPTYIKFQTKNKIKTILIDGIECEPYVSADKKIMIERTDLVLKGIEYLLWAFDCHDARICFKKKHSDLIHVFQNALGNPEYKDFNITVCTVKDFYPQGWEIAMIKSALGIDVPSGHLPSEFGVFNVNVSTVWGIYLALKFNMPVFERMVTINGEGVNAPANFNVRIGSPLKPLIDKCGGYKNPEIPKKIILGGPMMGASITTDDCILTKTVTSIIILDYHQIDATSCVRCGSCILSCPVGLQPVTIMKTMQSMPVDKAKIKALNPMKCIGCGLCSYSCTSNINVKEFVERAKIIQRLP
ncbi:MAG: RnfABCDGE type electron transport complex subunit C [Bacilli bacterium]